MWKAPRNHITRFRASYSECYSAIGYVIEQADAHNEVALITFCKDHLKAVTVPFEDKQSYNKHKSCPSYAIKFSYLYHCHTFVRDIRSELAPTFPVEK